MCVGSAQGSPSYEDQLVRVAYIINMSMPGMSAWTHREVDILTRGGMEISIYPLKVTEGFYMPRPEWHWYHSGRARTLAVQIPAFLSAPVKYLRLLSTAVKMRSVTEFLLAWDFSRDMRKVGVEHIHCHFGDRKLFVGYYCSAILDLPLSVTVHAYKILCNPNPKMFIKAAERCKHIVVQSEFNQREVMRVFGIGEEKFKIIRAHGDMSDERARGSVKLLIVAEFREKKGHEILFKALKKLGRDDLTLWVVGKGKLNLRAMAEDIGVSDITVFLGEVGKDLINILYDSCDVFVLPSRTAANGDREGIPAVIMEAMSHHKPVISTRHAGIPELVPEILVDENDVDGLAAAIVRLADDPALRSELGERNYRIIKQDFSDAAVGQLEEVFRADEAGNSG